MNFKKLEDLEKELKEFMQSPRSESLRNACRSLVVITGINVDDVITLVVEKNSNPVKTVLGHLGLLDQEVDVNYRYVTTSHTIIPGLGLVCGYFIEELGLPFTEIRPNKDMIDMLKV